MIVLRNLMLPIAVSLGVLILDQATKRFFELMFADFSDVMPVTPFLSFVLGHNRGISFGLFSSTHANTPYVLASVALAMIVGLAVWMWRIRSHIQKLALAAIIGGAIGNVIDRLEDGAVTDDFHWGPDHWPTFNLADAAITCGVAALLIETIWLEIRVTPPRALQDEDRRER